MTFFKKFFLYLLLVFLVCLLGVFLYYFQLGGMENLIQKRIDKTFKEQDDISFTIGSVSGDLISGIEFKDISLYYDDSLNFYQVAHFPLIKAGYSISNIWNKRYIFDYLYIDSAEITLKRDSTGRFLLPNMGSSDDQQTSSVVKQLLVVNDLKINNLNFVFINANDTLSFSNVNLEASVESRENTFSMIFNKLDFFSTNKLYQLESARGRLTYHENRIVFQELSIISDKTRIKLDGTVSLDELIGSVEFDVDNLDLTAATENLSPRLRGLLDLNGTVYFDKNKIDGSVFIAGDLFMLDFQNLYADFSFENKMLVVDTLYGTVFEGCSIDGVGEMDFSDKPEKYYLSADIKNFNLNNLAHNSFHSDFNGHLDMTGTSLKAESMLLDFDVIIHESSFDDYPIQNAVGQFTVTMDSIIFNDFFRVDYFENRFFVNGNISYKDSIDLCITANLDNLGRYEDKLFINKPGGKGYSEATLTGKTSYPDLKGFFISDSVWIYGLYADSLYSDFKIDRFLSGRQGFVNVDFFQGTAWSIPYNTAHAKLTLDSNCLFIDTAVIGNEFSELNGKGFVDYGEMPYYVELDTIALEVFDRDFYNDNEVKLSVDTAGFDFLQAVLKKDDAIISLDGRINYDETMDVNVLVNKVDIVPWVKLFQGEYLLGGLLSCNGRLSGNFLNPVIRLNGAIDSLSYRDLVLGDLTTSLSYSDKLLSIDSAKIQAYPGEYFGTGFLPVDLAFTMTGRDRFTDKPIDFRVTASDNRFDLVSMMLPSVEQLEGNFKTNLHLTGTVYQPHLLGSASLINGRLKYFDLEHPIFIDSALAQMEDNRIILNEIEIYSTENKRRDGKKRYAELDGEIVIKSFDNFYYNVEVVIYKDFPFAYELDDISGKMEGEFYVEGDTPPTVYGDLTLLSTNYMVSFAEPDEGSPIMLALSGENTWDLDVNVDILSNYWIKNEDIDAEFSGQMKLIRENGQYRFIGEMEILRGNGYLFDKTFRLVPGGMVVFEGEERFNPRLDIVGYTRIPALSQNDFEQQETSEMIELGVQITGTLDTVDINPIDGSNFSKEDIIPLIVGNYYQSDKMTTSGQIEGRLTGLLSTQISQIGTRQLNQLGIGVETFEIESYYGQNGNPLSTRISIGFYTAQGLYVYGKSPLSGQSGQEVGFEYRLNKALIFEGRRDEEQLYHLNLKLHLEFVW